MSNDTTTTETVEVEVTETEAATNPEVTPVAEAKAPKAAKPPVFDARGENPQRGSAVPVALNQRVRMMGEQDKGDDGKQKLGTITGIEYQRKRVVVKLDTQEKLIVRPASQAFVLKNSSGKVEFDTERMAKAVRGARKTAAAETPAPAPAKNGNGNGKGKGKGKKAATETPAPEATSDADAAAAAEVNAAVEAEQVEEPTVVAEVEVEVEPTPEADQDEAPAPVE